MDLSGALKVKLRYRIFDTDIGTMGAVWSPIGIMRIVLPQPSKENVIDVINDIKGDFESADMPYFSDLPERIQAYLRGERVEFPDQFDLAGSTAFQRAVWSTARTIPYGKMQSYSWIANQLGKDRAARAVGQALGSNPLPIIIPCHRVISSAGKLGGFSGGIDIKIKLLSIEGHKNVSDMVGTETE